MDSLVYLFVTTAKNYLRELRKKPALLISYALLALAIVGSVSLSMSADMSSLRLENAPVLLELGAFMVAMLLVLNSVFKGLDTGGSFFSMADVGLLFVSPVHPAQILVYGMLKQAGTALIGGIVILAQAPNLKNFFGIDLGGTLIIFLGYALSFAAAEALAMTVYTLTNSRTGPKRMVRGAVAALLLPLAVIALLSTAAPAELLMGLAAAATSLYARLIPIAGWTSAGISAFMSGNAVLGAICYLGNVAVFFGAVALMRRHGCDYYEDVLAATEASAAVKAARASGDSSEVSALRRKVKVRGTGLFGSGASAIMSRQLRESFRLNHLKLLDVYSFAVIGTAGMLAYTNQQMPGVNALLLTFIMTAYMQMTFMTITGPLKELTGHYIFLLPEKPITKLLWNCGAPALKALAESVLAYVLVGVILGLPAVTVIALTVANFCLCLMLLMLGVWGLRFFRAAINRGLLLLVYLLIVILALLPGIIGVGYYTYLNPQWTTTMVMPALLLSCWELFMALMFTYWSRNVLHNIDMIKIEIKK